MSMTERLAAAADWHARTTSPPPLEDVLMAVRLNLAEADLARLLWTDGVALAAHWSSLQTALPAASTPSTVAPAAASVPETAATAVPEAAPQPTPEPEAPALDPVVAARLEVLTAFVAARAAEGEDVSGVREENLVKAASSQRPEFKRYGPFLRRHATDLTAALAAVPDTPPAPEAAQSGSDVPAGQAPDAAGGTASVENPAEAPSGAATARPSGETDDTDFADFDWENQVRDPPPPSGISFQMDDTGGVQLRWPVIEDPEVVAVYRVVINDVFEPRSPKMGTSLVATFDAETVDRSDQTGAARHYTVWVHIGVTEAEARVSQPWLHAAGRCVIPVQDWSIREDQGTVYGQWTVAPGVEKVEVLRLPKLKAADPSFYDSGYQLPADQVNLGGFTDGDAQPMVDYVYRVYAKVGGAISPPVTQPIRIEAVLERISDLRVEVSPDDEGLYDLTWTKPALGKVEIYRSETQPSSAIDSKIIDRGSLAREGLTNELLVLRQLSTDGDQQAMRGVPWPEGWSRAYFTAATVLADDQIQVGNIVVLNRAQPVTELRLVERCDEQFLTFGWPASATHVQVYVSERGTPLVNPEAQQPWTSLTEEEYVQQGGAHLERQLPPSGCSVHVVAVSFANFAATLSSPTTIEYPGLWRIRYRFERTETTGGLFNRSRTLGPLRLLAISEIDAPVNSIDLTLVHHPNRLPLHSGDGVEFARRSISMAAGVTNTVLEEVRPPASEGFIRMFADLPADRRHMVAILDPAIQSLEVHS